VAVPLLELCSHRRHDCRTDRHGLYQRIAAGFEVQLPQFGGRGACLRRGAPCPEFGPPNWVNTPDLDVDPPKRVADKELLVGHCNGLTVGCNEPHSNRLPVPWCNAIQRQPAPGESAFGQYRAQEITYLSSDKNLIVGYKVYPPCGLIFGRISPQLVATTKFEADDSGESRAGKPANSPAGAKSRRRGPSKARAVFYTLSPPRGLPVYIGG
jgi:hypothetical protein